MENINPNSIFDLSICDNPLLSDCDIQSICEYLISPTGTVEIYYNSVGCNNQMEIEEECENNCLPEGITFTTQEEIDNFQLNYPGCTGIEGDVFIGQNYYVTDISHLNGLIVLTSIEGFLYINGNPLLSELSGLDNVDYVGGFLQLRYNQELVSLIGLGNLDSIGGSLRILGNDALTNLTGLDNLTCIHGSLGIGDVPTGGGGNQSLTSLTGLDNLTFIGGSIYITGNSVLTSLSGLEGLTSIEGGLSIGAFDGGFGNPSLVNFIGLNNLISVGGYIKVHGNSGLTSLSGLDNIDPVSIGGLSINDNGLLAGCEVQSICDYMLIPGGYVSVNNNAPGCNSQQEVEDACDEVSILEIKKELGFTISPNPCSGSVIIQYFISDIEILIFDMMDISGVKVKSQTIYDKNPGINEIVINLSDLPAGIYFCTLRTMDGIQTMKLIKL